MTDMKLVNSALSRLFNDEGQRIVFWNDPDREFESLIETIVVEGVEIVRLATQGSLEIKILLEKTSPTGKFILYSAAEEPDYEDDWLLDIRLYSGQGFRADRASILIQELGLSDLGLRSFIATRRKFFDAKERVSKLKQMISKDDTATALDHKMLAVVVKADHHDVFNIVPTLCHAWLKNNEVDLDQPHPGWDQIEKFDLGSPFWLMIKTTFGYHDGAPSLKNFLIRLFMTDLSYHLVGDLPAAFQGLLLPSSGKENAVVCLAQWRDSGSKHESYDQIACAVASITKLTDHLSNFDIRRLENVVTFREVEKRICSLLRDQVVNTANTIDANFVSTIARKRQTGHWAKSTNTGNPDQDKQTLYACYSGLIQAAELFALKNKYQAGFNFQDATAIYKSYESELFKFDQHYRLFSEASNIVESHGWDLMRSLKADVEACYVNWYLSSLATAWGGHIASPAGKLRNWRIDDIPPQKDFFEVQVKPYLSEADNRRAFVIISDAFRYEAAHELTSVLNGGDIPCKAELKSQLGVLPSYTTLGMASLLPHYQTMNYRDEMILVNDKSTQSTADRNRIIESVNGMACTFDELTALKKDELRELVKNKRVVYIYHNKIDAIGDRAQTESETFEAVRSAINELKSLVKLIINNLGAHITITADHGFLFAETFPGDLERSRITAMPAGTVKTKKRYVIGRNLPDNDNVWHGKIKDTAGITDDMEFWIPKGANRFHFVGGARFIHGGAMPQEIVVPVITVKQVRGPVADTTRPKPASVQVLGNVHRITAKTHRFELIQTEKVSERIRAVTLKIAIYDGNEVISDVKTIKFDSSSDRIDERKQWALLVLRDLTYSKHKPYRLVLKEIETDVEFSSVDVIIDRTFTDDF